MWFIYALATTLLWGAADLFYKKGADPHEKHSHLLTSVAVGIVMGAHALFMLLTGGIDYNPINILIYAPVSLCYILSMVIGYLGLRYLELSISSPIQNASGAVSCILCLVVLQQIPDLYSGIAIVIICAGVFLLGWLERTKAKDVAPEDKKYSKSAFALIFPILYCVIDALGSFFDAYYLDDINATPLVDVTEATFEDVANISYELTFFFVAIVLLFYILVIKKEKIVIKNQGNKFGAAIFETAGQFFYVYALAGGNAVVAGPMIGSYAIVSVILSRIFLKEKLKPMQYVAVTMVLIGIVIMGIVEGLAE